jgi:hypothetical protein
MGHFQSKDYFERRSSEEQAAAEQASDERAAQSHRELADHYRNIANGSEEPPVDDDTGSGEGILPKDFRILP